MCEGGGMRVIEMNFLPDVYVHCDKCNGKRYNRETLEIRYKGKSISDVLNMTVDEAVEFFQPVPYIFRKIKVLQEVGLGYITLGQSAVTLSGGEAQRVKLATELGKRDTGKTFYILDEPTTGLHFQDIQHLLDVLHKLVDRGNTVLVIEHNLDMIKVADHIIDIGPEGGSGGEGYCMKEPRRADKSERELHRALPQSGIVLIFYPLDPFSDMYSMVPAKQHFFQKTPVKIILSIQQEQKSLLHDEWSLFCCL